jgi:zona occludens toxin
VFKLVTGSPGDGKTSNELWDFLHSAQYKGRPKYCTPINGFDAKAHGVTQIDHIKDWQELPEGAAIFCDEVQDYCGTDLGREPPEWVKQLARHRHHGYDFVCTTQSPMFLHPFARKLAKPHVHYIRPWNMKGVRYTWDTVQNDPTTKTAKAAGQRAMVTPNPEVFKLYTSTVLDTHKARPPYKTLLTLAVALAVVIGGAAFSYMRMQSMTHKEPEPVAAVQSEQIPAANKPATILLDSSGEGSKPVWTEETIKPRMPGNLYSASVYDALTAPTDFPRVAACLSSEARGTCTCYTQQATPVDVPRGPCEVFVKAGAFDPWFTGRQQLGAKPNSEAPAVASATPQQNRSGASFDVVPDTSRTKYKPAERLN